MRTRRRAPGRAAGRRRTRRRPGAARCSSPRRAGVHRPHLGVVLVRRRVDVGDAGTGAAGRRPRGRQPRRPAAVSDACRRSPRAVPRHRSGASADGPALSRAGSSRSSPPRAAAARRRSRPTSPRRWPTAAARRCASSTSTSPSATSRSRCSCCPAHTIADAVADGRHARRAGACSRCSPRTAPGLDALLAPVEPGDGRDGSRPTRGRRAPAGAAADVTTTSSSTPRPAFTDHVLAAFDATDVYVAAGHARHPGAEEPAS